MYIYKYKINLCDLELLLKIKQASLFQQQQKFVIKKKKYRERD